MGHRRSRWEGGLSCCRSVARGNGQAGRNHTSGGFTRKRRTLVPSMLMEIAHKEIVPGTVVITLTGKLMMGLESEQIVTLVDELLSQGKRKIIFDLSGVKAIDSTGIATSPRAPGPQFGLLAWATLVAFAWTTLQNRITRDAPGLFPISGGAARS